MQITIAKKLAPVMNQQKLLQMVINHTVREEGALMGPEAGDVKKMEVEDPGENKLHGRRNLGQAMWMESSVAPALKQSEQQ